MDTPKTEKKLWFKAKRYGWGWTPATWQGWLIIALYVVILLRYGLLASNQLSSAGDTIKTFIVFAVVPTILLLWICYQKGEKPSWRWGEKKK